MSTPSVSFEFFPPKSLKASFNLWEALSDLAPFDPQFVSVTYGAGGTTRARTHDAVETIVQTTGLNVAGHLTCVDATRAETMEVAHAYRAAGVDHIVALRGDPPQAGAEFAPHPDGFDGALSLVEALAQDGFDISVAAYPETHPNAASASSCIDHLKAKFDAGATRAITQFFFEAETFLRFRDACAAAGITAPILPGVLPIDSWPGIQKFAGQCGTSIPQVLHDGFANADSAETRRLLALAQATELCDELTQEGVDHIHFYTLNTASLTRDVCLALGLSRSTQLRNVA